MSLVSDIVPAHGSPLIIDVAGTTLGDADRARLAHPLVGGVIHFARNWDSRAQMAALNAEIKALRPDLLICVDHEGGRVQRFRTDGFTRLPSMRALGARWMQDAMRGVQAAAAAGFVLASELRAVGVDFSFAPVLDLDHGASSVIGDRSFHRDPRVVALLAQSLAQGMAAAGMAHCAKHFPGHGYVKADSHVAIPVDSRSLKAILADDAKPFEWSAGTLTAVMPAHVIYRRVDERPAGFSRQWLQDILRGQLGFDGAIFTDDLSMEAGRYIAGRQLGFAEAALEALAAGCDLALLCNQSLKPDVLDEFLATLERAAASGALAPDEAREARRQALLPTAPAPAWDDLQAGRRYRHAQGLLAQLPA
ncbi:MAG: beta-N-acetylhexosaminidase [Comamonadaceae bacterium]|nr:MAG: beta-N-acetylhexosaminidase [Comamonadaceae bacterium]